MKRTRTYAAIVLALASLLWGAPARSQVPGVEQTEDFLLQIPIEVQVCHVLLCAGAPDNSEGEITDPPEERQATAEWRWQVAYHTSGSYVRYNHAITNIHTRGCCFNWRASVHAFLAPGPETDNEGVFSAFTDACATKTQDNVSVGTCKSKNFSSRIGKQWWIRSDRKSVV